MKLPILTLSLLFASTFSTADSKSVAATAREPHELSNLVNSVYQNTGLAAVGLSQQVFSLALKGFCKLRDKGLVSADSILTIIDYTKSSKEKRLFVIDLKKQQLEFNAVVAHGRNSGQEFARSFSNALSSFKSSLGFFITGDTYKGSNGYSLKLEGVDKGFNDKASERAIVMHGAPYANESVIRFKGFLGRSLGCPAVPPQVHKKIINKIRNGNALFIYYPEQRYLSRSEWLNS